MALHEISLNGNDWKVLPVMPSEWEWKRVWEIPEKVYPSLWIPAQVPGTVQDDAFDAGLIPDFTHDLNSRECEWTSERDWVYLKEFPSPVHPDVPPGGIVRLRFEGVDYACHVFLNGQRLGDHEGMYDAFEYDVTDLLIRGGTNKLVVVVEHAPREVGQIGRTSQVKIWKARFAYDWDWCTRLVPVGIWDSVSLLVTGRAYIRDVHVSTHVSDDLRSAEVGLSVDFVAREEETLTVHSFISYEGNRLTLSNAHVLSLGPMSFSSSARTDEPHLWWPNGYGEQPLYGAAVLIWDAEGNILDEREIKFGIRRVRAVANDRAPEGALPYVLEVNGQKVFLKGWNWAPIHQLYGREMPERYERWLRLAQHAHCNLLRVWGGGLLEKEVFYNLCDRYGIMVWQEFMQSSSGIDNRPSESPEYLRYICDQAEKMIPRKRNHPSLVIWCGGNELMHDDWRPLDDTHPALATLKDCVERLDPDRIYLPTSASGPTENADPNKRGEMHDVHGPWLYLGPEEHYRFYNSIDPLLHSEFGVEGAANLEAMHRANNEALLWPPDETNPLWMHKGSWWINREKVESLFGKIDDLETFVKASQFLQAEGLRYCIESNRRRKWRCAGTMPWQYNETWPNLSCTNVMDFYGNPRPSYWWCRRAYEPLHASAKYEKLGWRPGETFTAEVWLNNSLKPVPGCTVSCQLVDLRGRTLVQTERTLDVPAASGVCVETVEWPVGEVEGHVFILRLQVSARDVILPPVDYLFSSAGPPLFAPVRQAPRTVVEAQRKDDVIEVSNQGEVCALFVRLENTEGEWLEVDSNYFNLAPGESTTVRCTPEGPPLRITSWNADERRVSEQPFGVPPDQR